MAEENPKQYFIDDETLAKVWVALFESEEYALAQEVSASMIAQGCQEITGVDDNVLILNFWRPYLEEKGIIKFHDEEPEEVH
jgi:hypothetical protein